MRNPSDKRLVWSDIQEVMKVLGRPIPQRGVRGLISTREHTDNQGEAARQWSRDTARATVGVAHRLINRNRFTVRDRPRHRRIPHSRRTRQHDRWIDLIDIDGSINPATADFIDDSIAKAQAGGASALIIRLDTPGGLLSSARTIVKSMLNATVPLIVYVAPSGAAAASAGTFIVGAANIAAMAPGTTIGAAHPIDANGGEVTGKVGEKMENFTASFAKSIAHQRGRNEAWIEDAVRKSSSIGESEALKLHVIDLVANDLDDLLAKANGRTVTIADGHAIKLDLAGAAMRPRRT